MVAVGRFELDLSLKLVDRWQWFLVKYVRDCVLLCWWLRRNGIAPTSTKVCMFYTYNEASQSISSDPSELCKP